MFLVDDILDPEAEILQAILTMQLAICCYLELVYSGHRLPLAASFMPTLSIALSNARPIRNSRERSSSKLALHPWMQQT